MIFISPAEPKAIQQIGEVSSLAETYGADILITGHSRLVGIQRKQFPGDFLSSLTDGRLQTSLMKLSDVAMGVLVLEGKPAWTTSGALLGFTYGQGGDFMRSHLRALLLSAQSELGIAHHWTDSISDTIDFTRDMDRWAQKADHDTLFTRPNVKKGPMERKVTDRTRAAWILQGIQGIGYGKAGAIYDYFGRLPLRWDVGAKELMEVPGIGKGLVARLTEMIRETSDESLVNELVKRGVLQYDRSWESERLVTKSRYRKEPT